MPSSWIFSIYPITTDLRHFSLIASNIAANWPIGIHEQDLVHPTDNNSSLDLDDDSTQVVETSVTTTDNSPTQDCTHADDQTTRFLVELIWHRQ